MDHLAIDLGGKESQICVRRGDGQITASTGAGATRMVAAAHRRGHRGPSGDGQRLSPGSRGAGARSGWSPKGVAAKTGHHAGGVHRPRLSKTD